MFKNIKSNNVIFYVLIILFYLFLFLIIEIFVRFLFPDTVLYNRFHVNIDINGYSFRTLKPNSTFYHKNRGNTWEFFTDSNGFRISKDSNKTLNDKKKITVLIFGDSHTQGMEEHVQNIFSERINNRFCESGLQIKSYNAGISGSGTSEHLIQLKNYLEIFNPDFIIESFYPNDLDNNFNAYHKVIDDNLMEITKVHPAHNGIRLLEIHNNFFLSRWLSQNSYLYSLALNYIWNKSKKIFYKEPISELIELNNSEIDKKIDLFNLIIKEMAYMAENNDINFKIINIPSINYYDIEKYLYDENKKNLLKINYKISDNLHYEYGQNHLAANGHKIVADHLFNYICNN